MILIEGIIFWVFVLISFFYLFKFLDFLFDLSINNFKHFKRDIYYLILIIYKPFQKLFLLVEKLYLGTSSLNYKPHHMLYLIMFFTVLITLFYHQLFNTYFQGDEWFYFTVYLPYTQTWIGPVEAFIKSIIDAKMISGGGHLTPVSHFLFVMSVKIFGLTFWPYVVSSLLIHILNSILITTFTWKLIPSNKNLGIIAGIFFAVTVIPQQAVSWMMNYLLTSLSVTFLLLAAIKFVDILSEKKIGLVNWSILSLYSLLALLTKESAIIIFPLFILLTKLWAFKKMGQVMKLITLLLVLFIPYRFILPEVISYLTKQSAATIDSKAFELPIVIFRIITYPLKTISEVFVPAQITLPIAEVLTPLAYPTYGAERAVRGSNFLQFTQSAGSDILIYMFSLIIIFIIALLIYKYRNTREIRNTLIISFSIIILGALPLIMIAKYAPWWAYVTYIDSRHLYLPSIGAAIIFAIIVYTISISKIIKGYLSKLTFGKIIFTDFRVVSLLMFIWLFLNYILLGNELKILAEMGTDRQLIIDKIISSQPVLPEKAIFYIDSDSAYYGFAEFMPPFQTNFGQALAVIYYQKDQLPKEVLDFEFIKKGIVSQGYKEIHDRGFGYFLSLYKVVQLLEDKQLPVDSVIAYRWEGKNKKFSEITQEVRSKITAIQEERALYKDWKKVSYPGDNLTFRTPPNGQVKEVISHNKDILKDIDINSANFNVNLKVRVKNNGVGIDPNVKPQNDSDGNLIGDNFTYRHINMNDGSKLAATVTTTGSSIKYFFPTNIPPDKIIELTILGHPTGTEQFPILAEKFISFIQFPNNLED